MTIRTLTIALVAGLLASGTQAQEHTLETLVLATELSPANIIFPQSMNGMMTFRPCAEECDEEYERARITDSTRYTVNGRGVTFEDFRKDFAVIKGNDDSYALVSVDTKTKTVVSIQIEG